MPTYTAAFQDLRSRLQPLYDAGEAAAIAREAMLHITGRSYSESLLFREDPLPAEQAATYQAVAARLAAGEPLQYVLGFAFFMGRPFRVDERVLIPRPETEELVQWIIDDYRLRAEGCSILDVGTGSGCIPVSLALALPASEVTACDISGDALEVARDNSRTLGATVQFLELDFLDPAAVAALPAWDIIVSNPPYIPESLKETLHPNVRDHEPATALFVPAGDPLLFYRAIAAFGHTHLKPGGAIYCELHADHAAETEEMFRAAGYDAVSLRPDISGLPRMLKAGMYSG